MPEPDPKEQDLYSLVLETLRRLEAEQLAQQIERTVSRGSVASSEAVTAGRKKSEKLKIVTSMSSRDSLAVALEFLVAAAEVPLMVNHVRQNLPCISVEWKPDEPGPRAEDVAVMPVPMNIDLAALKRGIDSLNRVMSELKLNHPETV
jgi:hypothetical protein